MNDIMNMTKSLGNVGLLIKGIIETIKDEAKERKYGFLGMLLGTLGASLLANLLTDKRVKRLKITESRWRHGIFNSASSFN